MMNYKQPKECASPEEIRNEIDKIDKEIISLFSKRHLYVEEIVRFKNTENEIIASERKEHVIRKRREWAANEGLNADLFEQIYTLLINSNIQHEMNLLSRKKN